MNTIEKKNLIKWFNSSNNPFKRAFVRDILGVGDSYICNILSEKKNLTEKKARIMQKLQASCEVFLSDFQHVARIYKK